MNAKTKTVLIVDDDSIFRELLFCALAGTFSVITAEDGEMGVKIARHIDGPGLRDTNCIYCGRCVEGCGTKGKLIKMKIGG